jgi:hypothetical protein
MTKFDLTEVSDLQYRNKLRLARYLGVWLAAMIGGAILYRWLFYGLDPALLVGYIFAIGAALVGALCAIYFAAPGPTGLQVDGDALRLWFRGGRVLSIDIRDSRFRLRLAEALPPTRRPWGGVIPDAPCFAIVRWRWFPLTPESYTALLNVLRNSGIPERSSFRPNPPAGGFRVSDFDRTTV